MEEHKSLKTSRSEVDASSVDRGSEDTENMNDNKRITYKIRSPNLIENNVDPEEEEEDETNSFEEEEDNIDAQLDKEVEEFRLRLESIHRNESRPKIQIPAFESFISASSGSFMRSSNG